jgi:glycosyltransferase involved in cell wall biosynthesis
VALSVALATHDGERWLPELLSSLVDQTRPPDELVVCDDASTDGSREVLDAFAATAPFPVERVDHGRRQGPVRAFERALEA